MSIVPSPSCCLLLGRFLEPKRYQAMHTVGTSLLWIKCIAIVSVAAGRRQAALVSRFMKAEMRCRRSSLRAFASVVM